MTARRVPAIAVFVAVSLAWAADSAYAQGRGVAEGSSGLSAPAAETELVWNEAWPRFRPWEYVATIALLVSAPSLAALDGPEEPRWRGGILFDDWVSERAALSSSDARRRIAEISNTMWYATQAFPLIVDAVLVAGVIRQSYDVAVQLALIDTLAMLTTGFLSRMLHVFVGRDRPTAAPCEEDSSYDSTCLAVHGQNAGFYSGHTALAFTGAGLTCAHHVALPLYGGNFLDAAACGITLASATTVGVFRLISSRHYLTDILVGAGAGFAIGYVLPMLLHFTESDSLPRWAGDETPEEDPGDVIWLPYFASDHLGGGVTGAF
jgi:membrane-associated phospholipid phosphatase